MLPSQRPVIGCELRQHTPGPEMAILVKNHGLLISANFAF
jgi:hypothetical protein